MSRIKLEFVQAFIDRHGRVRHYFRRRGYKRIPLPGLPGSEQFMAAYRQALGGEPPKIEIGASRTIAGTVNDLVAAYLDCSPGSTSPHKSKAPTTQQGRRTNLEAFRLKHGDKRVFRTEPNGKRVMLLTREHLQKTINEKASSPFAQRNLLSALRAMFKWAVGEGRVPENPTLGVEREKIKSTGYKTWSEADIERYEAKHPIGPRARLAFALLLYTGQRRGDVVQMGPQHVHKGILTIDQGKTEGGEESHLEIPVHPKLQKIIDATPTVGMRTFLVTKFGKPYTPGGFGNWFRERCDEANCPDIAAHGLRKGCARRLAEIGCSAHEIAAITGHASLAEVERYTKAANRKRLAKSAMTKLVEAGS
jgi:integrase